VALVKLLWPLFTQIIKTIGNYVLGQLICNYSRPTSSQCSLLTHKSSVCNPAFVLQKEIKRYYKLKCVTRNKQKQSTLDLKNYIKSSSLHKSLVTVT